ncbi:hypothetical protein ABW21_db0208706 [Orbilia brochopaga]|nr:hypothetical protein ABW21_db0208706 [Drechslerella brochopaga]
MRRLSLVASVALLGLLQSQTALARSIAVRAGIPDGMPVCAKQNNTGLLNFGVTFCNRKRTSTSTAQRLGGAGKQSDISAALSPTSVVETVEPTPQPNQTPTDMPPGEPVYPTSTPSLSISSLSSTFAPIAAPSPVNVQIVSSVSPSTPDQPTSSLEEFPELHVATSAPSSAPVVASSTFIASTSTSTFARETTSSVQIAKVPISSTAAHAVAPSSEDSTTAVISEQISTTSVPPRQFNVEEPSSKTEGSSSDILVIQTANPTTGTAKGQVTDAPAKTSAPPTATADEPSSASASAMHMFNQASFASFLVCLLALFFLH